MAKNDKNWKFDTAAKEIERASLEESEEEQEKIACEILRNHELTEGLLDKIISLISKEFGFSRPTVKKWGAARKKSEQESDENQTSRKGEISASNELWNEFLTGKGRKITYQEAVEIINRAAIENDDEQIEPVAKKIISNIKTNEGGYDLLVKRISKDFGLSRPLVKRWVRIERERESIEENETATHAEIAELYINDNLSDNSVGAEGDIWEYGNDSRYYEKVPTTDLRIKIGNDYAGKNCKTGSHYKAISEEIYIRKVDEKFFSGAPYGVATKSGFYRVNKDKGNITIEKHAPRHRIRWKLPYDPAPLGTPLGPLMGGYLDHAFGGRKSPQALLLQETLGAILTGIFADKQKAVLFKGEGENGKSVILDMMTNFFPPSMRSSIRPEQFRLDNVVCELAGKIVNIVGELDKDQKLSADFKDIIGADGERTVRPIYKNPFTLRARAAHIFSGNHYPLSKDHSHGFYRRWLIFVFKNGIPEKRIERMGQKIAKEEGPQILRWMLDGAAYLLQNDGKLSITQEHKNALLKWKSVKNSVFGFFNDKETVKITGKKENVVQHKICYAAYKDWCLETGAKHVGYQEFLERARSIVTADYKPSPSNRKLHFKGVSLLSAMDSPGFLY